ncbi:DUF3135 domain-containing protein [Marinospirillum sp.]|uniref:DUF3135 domain-containing protein n=1 Tax=Marinospirillum sp. TaxID=2183934 RepID=UPI0028703800|nr:DUF3135 domain-containing protein [Marinospirillum sp.]
MDFDELVRLHREGKLEAYRDEMNRQFVNQTPERRGRRHRVEQLLFQIQAAQTRSKNGLGASLRLSKMMFQKLDELNGFFCAQKNSSKQNPEAKKKVASAQILAFTDQEDS